MLGIGFILFITGLIYFRHYLLLCFGLKELASWLGTFIVGFVIIQLAWPPANTGWMTIVPILFALIAKVGYNRLYSSSLFFSEQSWELENPYVSMPQSRRSKNPEQSCPSTSNRMSRGRMTKTRRPDRWTLAEVRGSFSA